MTATKKYTDIKTGKSYEQLPPGKVPVPNYELLSPEAQNRYVEYLNKKNPYELPEIAVYGNSQDLPIIDPTETDQNLKVRDYNKKVDRWVNSEYSPENQFNNYTFGLPNRLSPTQNIGLAIDISQGDNIWNSMMGNSGIVSDQFYRDNPKLATGVNLLGDMIIPYSAYKTYQFVKPDIRNYIISRAFNKEVRNTTLPQESFGFNVGWGPRQTIGVTHASESSNPLGLYNPNRWDVINEGANPFGVWFQGKWGIPRTTSNSTAEKAVKAQRARDLFAGRPFIHSGELTLNKPIIVNGEVPSRSALSWQAERMGADGIIYNNVYDNGFNNNQIIHSFRLPEQIFVKSQPHNYDAFGTSIKADGTLDLGPNFLEWSEAENIRGFYKNIFFPKYYSNRKDLYIQPKFNFMSPGVPGRFKISTKNARDLGGTSIDGEATIYLNDKFPIDEIVVHEGAHNFRDNFSNMSKEENITRIYNNITSNRLYEPTLKNPKYYTEQELQDLNDAYTFTEQFLSSNRVHPMAEKSATNTQAQYAIAKASGAKTPQELNIVIDKMSDDDILYTIQQSNSYGRSFVQYIKSLSPEQQELKIRAIRNALKTIPVIGGIYTIGNQD